MLRDVMATFPAVLSFPIHNRTSSGVFDVVPSALTNVGLRFGPLITKSPLQNTDVVGEGVGVVVRVKLIVDE